jgi:alkanesulfonate monooxygenase SsuD/methylene tetrahydromethanopterin reductase-like flavin-dependent oxidoreductase (luciferase family)
LVYALPLYHPMRLIEEICMLDQMSGGRLDIGFGRGASQIESAMYGNDPAKAELMYVEGLELIMRGLTQKSLDFHGQFYSFDDVPMELEPLQKPHPPVWYGVHSTVSAERAARQRLNIVSLDPADKTRTFTDRFRQVWHDTERIEASKPMIGLGRFIVIAATDEEAIHIARRAYPKWHRSFNYLFNLRGGKGPVHQRPADLETLIKIGQGIAGSPNTVTEFLKAQMTESGANYVVGQFAFGDLSLSEILRSLEFFTRHVMPELRSID